MMTAPDSQTHKGMKPDFSYQEITNRLVEPDWALYTSEKSFRLIHNPPAGPARSYLIRQQPDDSLVGFKTVESRTKLPTGHLTRWEPEAGLSELQDWVDAGRLSYWQDE